jgi:uncharacterized protein (DUF302 family)
VEKLAEEVGEEAVVGKLNSDENPEIAAQYGIRSIPTLILFKGGRPAKGFVGVTSAPNLRAAIRETEGWTMEKNGSYKVETSRSFEEACRRVEEKAPLEGFRVLKAHDMKANLGEKGYGIEPTLILEVCNAGLAHEALSLDPETVLLMPCSVVVRERAGKVTLAAFLPEALVEDPALRAVAHRVGERLLSLVDTAASSPSCCGI